ncbi:MAG: hypothetical protein JRH08_14200 [Deltaproteobacteria bacterium]|nr:hypothetical protein [Deltaproteobacteria bacterium]MBW2024683.1 hypothetical protein [Deltaproteobacteria bacterium]MBW2126794.1 hypothetical protein [Deltaproteobacteria bacterium]
MGNRDSGIGLGLIVFYHQPNLIFLIADFELADNKLPLPDLSSSGEIVMIWLEFVSPIFLPSESLI